MLTCSVGLRTERGMVDIAGVCAECQPCLRLAASSHSLKKAVHLPRGSWPGLWVLCQSQAAQAPRKMWAAARAHSQLGGTCDPGAEIIAATCLPPLALAPALLPLESQPAHLPLAFNVRSCVLLMKREHSRGNDLLPLWRAQAFLWASSAVSY